MAESISTVFTKLNKSFSGQEKIREALKNARDKADISVRTTQSALSTLHAAGDLQSQAGKVADLLKTTGEPLKAIENALPDQPGAFHRYADIWHHQLHMAAMVAVVLDFVKNGTLANVDKVKEMVGADIQLPIEDYLLGVCNAVAELARLSLNRVIQNDYTMPKKCQEFGSNVFEGFKELNLRNDFLRKRYDGMKYDVKKMEDILYDLSIRGLLPTSKKRKLSVQGSDEKRLKLDDDSKTDKHKKPIVEVKGAAKPKTNGNTASEGKAKDTGRSDDGNTSKGDDKKDSPLDATA